MNKAKQLKDMGQQLIDDDHYAIDCIRPKCIELQRMCEQYKELVRKRYDMLQKSRDLQDRIEKVFVNFLKCNIWYLLFIKEIDFRD